MRIVNLREGHDRLKQLGDVVTRPRWLLSRKRSRTVKGNHEA
jgi:hypothetical protein